MLALSTLSRLRYYLPALLALLLASSAVAAPTTDTHPSTKRQPVAASKGKATAPAPAPGKQSAPAPVVAPVAAALPSAPDAPQTVQLRGVVLAADGRPCAGASVYPAGAPRQLVVTDAKGAFALPVPAGTAVSLRVEYFGEGSSRVEVPAPGPEPLRITLGK